MPKVIDLSLSIENYASEPFPPSVMQTDHKAGARRLAPLAKIDPTDFPDGMALASDQCTLSTHSGTHVDAPYHYGPTSGGRPARTIDEIPLEWCYGPGVVLDMRHKPAGSEITAADCKEALEKLSYTLKPGDIVMIQTGTDKYWGTSKYLPMQSGLGVEATAWILDQGIRCIGIDAWGMDRPMAEMGAAYHGGDKEALWPSHFYGRKVEYLQIEKVANLDQIPALGAMIAAFPVKIHRGSAGWTRCVAIIDD